MLGSGCTPEGGLSDGVWMGWVDAINPVTMEFDLACLHDGDPAIVTNVNPKLRSLMVGLEATVRMPDASIISYTHWVPEDQPVWIYANLGMVTEIAYPTIDVIEARAGWVETEVNLPVSGGCCGAMYQGEASPSGPWPSSGLQADGVYAVEVTIDPPAGDLMLDIRKFVPCAERPELCLPDYLEGDLGIDWPNAIARRVPLDYALTVRVVGASGLPQGIEGSGTDYATLLADRQQAWDTYIAPDLQAGADLTDLIESLFARGAADPNFPYGKAGGEAAPESGGGMLVYRGPLGLEMEGWLMEPVLPGPAQLEMVDGLPILIIFDGFIGG